MRLSTPIYRLKRQARLLSRRTNIRLHQALDDVAIAEGFQSWSHLASATCERSPAGEIFKTLRPGDLLLLGARPGHGKTLLGLELAAMAAHSGGQGYFFTLDFNAPDVANAYASLGIDTGGLPRPVIVDTSDEICAAHIIDRLVAGSGDSLAVVDYLQLLDQRRQCPPLETQIGALRDYAKKSGTVIVLISQIDRRFDLTGQDVPDLADIRLPNPLDLSLFDRACFLHEGEIRLRDVA